MELGLDVIAQVVTQLLGQHLLVLPVGGDDSL
jgi:hypothetical protein